MREESRQRALVSPQTAIKTSPLSPSPLFSAFFLFVFLFGSNKPQHPRGEWEEERKDSGKKKDVEFRGMAISQRGITDAVP